MGFQFDRPVRCLSTAVLGGGITYAHSVVNLHVDKDYSGMDPAGDIRWAARQAGLPGPYVGLMTAVMLQRAIYRCEEGIHLLATAGVRNATTAGLTPPWEGGPGTINLIAFLESGASDGALAGALITMTEAKVRALAHLGISCPATGAPATGTSTDAIAVACLEGATQLPFLGPLTPAGHRLARLSYEGIIESLSVPA